MLKRVSIQNFKSLKDVTLNLQKVNLLIGPNNSGKTNFLKALEFFKDRYANEHSDAEEDFSNYSFKKSSKIKFLIENENNIAELIILGKLSKRNFKSNTGIFLSWKENNELAFEDAMIVDNYFYNRFRNTCIYKPDPNKIDKPGPVGMGEELVNADASNLVGFLDLMLGKYRRTIFTQIEADLNKCVLEFSEINLDDAADISNELRKQHGDGSVNRSYKRLGLTNSQQKIIYWSDELSEGTLYFLALLCIINQPNPPKLLLLEEPEKGIHPRRIREVMNFIFQLVEEKDIQVILTTHNENVLNEFVTMPESVFVFDKDEEGATQVLNLQTDIIEPSHQRSRELGIDEVDFTTNLSENWMYGLLGGVPEIL